MYKLFPRLQQFVNIESTLLILNQLIVAVNIYSVYASDITKKQSKYSERGSDKKQWQKQALPTSLSIFPRVTRS